ncbi:hypothetical protein IC762_01335 [Bradyrhizobium genosp. L]|uniref:hypothetical protein n=1 Tax=Bradyrhizobium genosp. L TaxID=83637 RepID=UPI0018A30B81|nr:hypothetical protein [Bradyrhizobium genosp. L]QPF85010.1 hypothetical protein IC762_01335 [Bradyrhizobium genosp. L]
MGDIFEFWSRIERGAKVHPADVKAFDRMNAERHGFQLDCLPGNFGGRLRSAPVVLLYLSPGYSPADVDDAKSEEGIDHRFRSWKGDEPFRENGPGRRWLESRTRIFGEFASIQQNCAVLNIGAYHSKDVKSYPSLLALPSSRVSLTWAQDYLFAQAEAGKRIVICMRSASYWGLDTGRQYPGTLFAPEVSRSGHLVNGPEKDAIVETVQRRIGASQ